MKKRYSKLMAFGMAAALMVTALPYGGMADKSVSAAEKPEVYTVDSSTTAKVKVPDAAAEFQDLTAEEIIQAAGIGWNLGNTMDAWSGDNFLTGETLWQKVVTTKALIKSVHDMGFNTIRIPVSWCANINDTDYSVDEEWMSRVQEIVDYAISEDMYVILNVHHDGCRNDDPTPHGWLNVDGSDEDFAAVHEKFNGLWATIAERFKNYDEHLMFAAMNEVFGDDPLQDGNTGDDNGDCLGWKPQYGYTAEYKELLLKEFERIAALNQDFVNIVRKSGGNNDQRWLVVQPHNTQIHAVFDAALGFQMPTDTAERIMMEVHDYDSFTLSKSTDETVKGSYAQQFSQLKSEYVDQGIPVVIGECGFKGKDNRRTAFEGVAYLLKEYSMIGCIWDEGGTDNNAYAIVDRTEMKPSDVCVAAVMRGFYNDAEVSDIVSKAEIVPMTDMEINHTALVPGETDTQSALEMAAGETEEILALAGAPEDTNDTIVWSTSDANVATVYNGIIRAKIPGTVTITARALSGTAVQEIVVTVTAKELDEPTTGITTNYEAVELGKGQETYLTAVTNNSEKVRFISEDESIANVSCDGRILAKDKGTTNIKLVTADGFTKTVEVKVTDAPVITENELAEQINLVIQAQYNSGSGDTYYGGSMRGSEYITVTSDGTYTLSLDTAVDLPEDAAAKGVTNLNGLGSLYISDYDVATGVNKKTAVLPDTMISYSSIKVNDTELLSAETEDYPAVKNSRFDTGNPLNAWDGSVVPEGAIHVDKDNFVITFPNIENPTKISITFTIKGYREKPQETAKPSDTPTTTATVKPSVSPSTSVAPSEQPTVKKPAKVAGLKLKAAKKKLTVSWKKQSGMKYKVAYSTSKAKLAKLKNGKVKAKGVKVVDAASAKKVIKKLKSKKKYYVKVCAYTKIDGKKTYGKWSAVKNKKVK